PWRRGGGGQGRVQPDGVADGSPPGLRAPFRHRGCRCGVPDRRSTPWTARRCPGPPDAMQRSPIRWTSSPGTGFAVPCSHGTPVAVHALTWTTDRLHVGLSEWCTGPVQHLTGALPARGTRRGARTCGPDRALPSADPASEHHDLEGLDQDQHVEQQVVVLHVEQVVLELLLGVLLG